MSKTVSFGGKPPSSLRTQAEADAWVNDAKPVKPEAVKRFTFDVPLALHKRIKMKCTAEDRQMADVMRELLERHFPPAGDSGAP